MRAHHLLLPGLLLLAACASNWTFVSSEPHPALKPDATIAKYERGRGADHERRVEIQSHGDEVRATSLDALMPYVQRPDNPAAAIAFADLVRRLPISDSGARGMSVMPDRTLSGTGGSGRYSRTDAAGWGVDFEPTARANAGGFEVSHVVLLAPVPHPVLPNVATPWRLVLMREVVMPDGTIRFIDETTLTNGHDAERFAEF